MDTASPTHDDAHDDAPKTATESQINRELDGTPIAAWEDRSYTCTVCNSYMLRCSHCRICGKAVCLACIQPQPEHWLTSRFIDRFDRMPAHVDTMKTCTPCGERQAALEKHRISSRVILPSLVVAKAPPDQWLDLSRNMELDEELETPTDLPSETVRTICQELVARHATLKAQTGFLATNFEPEANDVSIMAADPVIANWDVMMRTPKYLQVETSMPVSLPVELAATFFSDPASAIAVRTWAASWSSYIAVVAPLMHPVNMAHLIPRLTGTNAAILLQRQIIDGTMFPRKAHVVKTMRGNLEKLETFLCLETTEDIRHRACAHFIGQRATVFVRNRTHCISGLTFFEAERNPDAANTSGSVELAKEAVLKGTTRAARVKIVCTNNRIFHACFGVVSSRFLHAAAFVDQGTFGCHYRKLFTLGDAELGNKALSSCILFDDRDFRSGDQGRDAIRKATVESRQTTNMLLTLLQHATGRRVDVDRCRWTVDRGGRLIMYGVQFVSVAGDDGDADEDADSDNHTDKEEEEAESTGPESTDAVGEEDAVRATLEEIETCKQKSPECLYWALRILLGISDPETDATARDALTRPIEFSSGVGL